MANPTFQADCPWCGTKGVGFALLHELLWESYADICRYDVLGRCALCHRGAILTFRVREHEGPPMKQTRAPRGTYIQGLSCEGISPARPSTDAPRHTPKSIASFFQQGKESENSGFLDAAGAMFRKALEVGLKVKFPDINSSWTPYKRIEQAAKDNKLTPELAQWAHQIRALGNDATHEEVFTRAQAKEMSAFTEIMLQYIFTLPGDLEIARKAIAEREEGTDAPDSRGGGARGSRPRGG